MPQLPIWPSSNEVSPETFQVSVVIPCFNQADRLEHAVISVLAQGVPCEILVVNDGSRPDQTALIQQVGQRFGARILHVEIPRGPAAARNMGIEASRVRYIAFLDADDVWLPGKLRVQLFQMQTRGLGFTYTRYGNVAGDRTRVMPAPSQMTRQDLLRNTAIGCSTVMLCREFIGERRFPSARVEDLAFWAELLDDRRTAHLIGDEVYVHRVLGGRSSNKLGAAWRYWRTLRDTLNIPPHDALPHFVHYAARATHKHWLGTKRAKELPRAIADHTR